ncbi:MAG: helix-turn-helix domain containing protein [Thomasclavelia spiroformis]|uniref:helix-turn-helix domain containing protein n=2 Tax=Bacillota TaxID=1239 RepID=UPI000567FD38|nr:helix-turn-helix domain containing protein [Coprobacillus cateniformis]MBS5286463.1 helix-turn-helix domain-containing protein [Erysipelotrichaceae bacterium]MBS5600328.1 helix-turn-helix domain-containing protein [Coprobacillus cateniformis]MCR0394234.1 helix-turn-helix domain containing protein [[Clostridium] innocuum]
MSYNYIKEFLKWQKWKEQEEQILRNEKVNEKIIQELRQFDWQQFNSERRFKRHQNVTDEIYFLFYPVQDKKEIKKVEDILDTIENEALFEYLKETDPIVLEVILLKINGYSIKEISKILELSTGYIYKKIRKLKKFQK